MFCESVWALLNGGSRVSKSRKSATASAVAASRTSSRRRNGRERSSASSSATDIPTGSTAEDSSRPTLASEARDSDASGPAGEDEAPEFRCDASASRISLRTPLAQRRSR